MKQPKTFLLLSVIAAVLLLGVAYASMANITLQVTGNATAVPNADNFRVYFNGNPNATADDGLTVNATAAQGSKTATIAVGGFDTANDTATIKIPVYNDSTDLDAILSTAISDSYNKEYFEITSSYEMPNADGGKILGPKYEMQLVIVVKCIKTPVDTVNTDFTVTLTAKPINVADNATVIN